jgi:hypothetical protein
MGADAIRSKRETNGVLRARVDSRRYNRRLRQRRSNASTLSQMRLVDSARHSARWHRVLCICAGVVFIAVAATGLALLIFDLHVPPLPPTALGPDLMALAKVSPGGQVSGITGPCSGLCSSLKAISSVILHR